MNNNMEKIVNLCKQYGFVFPGSEIYDGYKKSLDDLNIDESRVNMLTSAEVQKDEEGLLELAKNLNKPIYFVDLDLLKLFESQDIQKSELRKNFGMVLQETWIFSGTVMDNVRYAKPDATDEEVIEACKKAHADTFIQTLPDGYQTHITSQNGLSEGQKQMLAIARVMLLDNDIVILDEATSNIDTRSEKIINDAFDELMKDRTSIVIAHRLSTIVHANLILVLKDGHIIESGNHQTLMDKKGFYHSMYSSQFK